MMRKEYFTTCPKCGAKCKKGHDEDGLVACACCRLSFTPKEFFKEDYGEVKKNAKKIYTYCGWEAFK